MRDASICGLGQTAAKRDRVGTQARSTPSSKTSAQPGVNDRCRRARRSTARPVTRVRAARRSSTRATSAGIETPTLCFLESLTPVNACRVCVVELEGSRVLVPACARKAEAGMVDAHRHRARAPQPQDGAGVSRVVGRSFDRTRRAALLRAVRRRSRPLSASDAATVAQPVKVDNELYVRDYSKCILCYKCVEACGTDAQNTFAIAVAGRGFDAHISTEYDVPLPDSACVYCGNCIGVCPTGALMFSSEHELRARGDVGRSAANAHRYDLPVLRRRLHAALHVQDDAIVKVTSPIENGVTHGNLCIKGRFGFIRAEPAADDVAEDAYGRGAPSKPTSSLSTARIARARRRRRHRGAARASPGGGGRVAYAGRHDAHARQRLRTRRRLRIRRRHRARARRDRRHHVLPRSAARPRAAIQRRQRRTLAQRPSRLERFERHFTVSSACGVCGRAQLDSLRELGVAPIDDGVRVAPRTALLAARTHARSAARLRIDRRPSRRRALRRNAASRSPCAKTSAVTTPSTNSSAGDCSTRACRSRTMLW